MDNREVIAWSDESAFKLLLVYDRVIMRGWSTSGGNELIVHYDVSLCRYMNCDITGI